MEKRIQTVSVSPGRGMTLVEAIIAISVVAWLLTMALNSVGAAKRTTAAGGNERLALEIAESLLAEIATQPYADAQDGPGSGPTAAESATGNRSLFNDVNDYEGWVSAPPLWKDGTPRNCPFGWREEIDMTYLVNNNITQTQVAFSNVTRIRVLIYDGSRLLANVATIRTRGPTDLRGCCLPDGSCADLPATLCTARGGTPGAANSTCHGSTCSGMVAYWPMDEGAGSTAEDHAEDHDASLSGVSWDVGKYGTAVSFAAGSASVPYGSNLALDNGLTICGWIYKNSNSGFDNILIRGSFNNKKTTYHLRTSSSNLAFGFHYRVFTSFSLFTVYTSGVTLKTKTWTHVAATFDPATGEVILYVDGTEYYQGTTSRRPEANLEPITIGRTDAGDQFDGLIDDLRLYNVALKKSDINKAMNEPASGSGGAGGAAVESGQRVLE